MPALSLESHKCAYRKNVTNELKIVLFIVASPDMARNDSKPVSMRAFLSTAKKTPLSKVEETLNRECP